jgi:hypothetical protein
MSNSSRTVPIFLSLLPLYRINRPRAAAGVFSVVTGGRAVFTSAAVGGGAPGPPKQSRGGNREGAPSPAPSCARSDQAGASELKKKPLRQLGLEKQRPISDPFGSKGAYAQTFRLRSNLFWGNSCIWTGVSPFSWLFWDLLGSFHQQSPLMVWTGWSARQSAFEQPLPSPACKTCRGRRWQQACQTTLGLHHELMRLCNLPSRRPWPPPRLPLKHEQILKEPDHRGFHFQTAEKRGHINTSQESNIHFWGNS